MALVLETSFDRLPPELLDMITNKVRQSCPRSFQALERTSRGLRDSARRCSKTLVMAPHKSLWGFLDQKQERVDHHIEQIEGVAPINLKLPEEILFKEIVLRPGLPKLVLMCHRKEEDYCHPES